MKIVKSQEKSSLLIKGVSETIEKEAKEQKDDFFCVIRYIKSLFIRYSSECKERRE